MEEIGAGMWEAGSAVVEEGGELTATSVVEISNLASNATAHQKETHTSSPRLALHLPTLFSSLCYQGEGLMSPTPARRG